MTVHGGREARPESMPSAPPTSRPGDIALEHLPERIGRHDVVFEAAGVPEIAFGALPTLAPNGLFIMSGKWPGSCIRVRNRLEALAVCFPALPATCSVAYSGAAIG
jgi:hypothetical protein